MSKNLSIRAQGYDVMFCYTRNGRKFAKIRTDHRLKGGFWASLQTMLRMSEEIEAEFYGQLRMPLKSHVRLIAYDKHDDPVVVALMRLEHKLSDHTNYNYVLRHHRGEGDEQGSFISHHDKGLFLAIWAMSRKCREYEDAQKGRKGFLTLNREAPCKNPFDKLILLIGV